MSSLHHFINALSNSKAPSGSWGQTGPNSLPSSQLARKCLWVQTANLGREKFRPRDHRPKAHHSPGNLCRGTWNCPKMCPKSLVDWENHNFQSSYSHCNEFTILVSCFHFLLIPKTFPVIFPTFPLHGCGSPRADATFALRVFPKTVWSERYPEFCLHPQSRVLNRLPVEFKRGFTRSSMKAIGRDSSFSEESPHFSRWNS